MSQNSNILHDLIDEIVDIANDETILVEDEFNRGYRFCLANIISIIWQMDQSYGNNQYSNLKNLPDRLLKNGNIE